MDTRDALNQRSLEESRKIKISITRLHYTGKMLKNIEIPRLKFKEVTAKQHLKVKCICAIKLKFVLIKIEELLFYWV